MRWSRNSHSPEAERSRHRGHRLRLAQARCIERNPDALNRRVRRAPQANRQFDDLCRVRHGCVDIAHVGAGCFVTQHERIRLGTLQQSERDACERRVQQRPLTLDDVPVPGVRFRRQRLRRARHEVRHDSIHRDARSRDEDSRLPGRSEVGRVSAFAQSCRQRKRRVLLADRAVGAARAGDHRADVARHQLLHRHLDRDERRRARRVDDAVHAVEVEHVGAAAGGHVAEEARERVEAPLGVVRLVLLDRLRDVLLGHAHVAEHLDHGRVVRAREELVRRLLAAADAEDAAAVLLDGRHVLPRGRDGRHDDPHRRHGAARAARLALSACEVSGERW